MSQLVLFVSGSLNMKAAFVVVAIFAIIAAVVVGSNGKNIVKFTMKDSERSLFDYLMKPNVARASRLGEFRYINCGDNNTEILNLTSLVLSPDPIVLPGTLNIGFSGQIKSTVDTPLKAEVKLAKKVGTTWIKIPCIGNIGSCTYDDLCQLLSGAVCPPPFDANKIPCKCPFTAGNYTLPATGFEIDVSVFPAGDYHGSANLSFGSKFVGCVELYASFQ